VEVQYYPLICKVNQTARLLLPRVTIALPHTHLDHVLARSTSTMISSPSDLELPAQEHLGLASTTI
jgi:hypothetical protein